MSVGRDTATGGQPSAYTGPWPVRGQSLAEADALCPPESAGATALAELGPTLRPRCAIHLQAVELSALARLAVEFSTPGRTLDLARAERQIARIRGVLGDG